MKELLLVTSEFPPQPGGIGTHAYQLTQALITEGFVVHVITDQRSNSGDEEAVFDATLPFKVTRAKKRSLRFLMYLDRIVKVFKALRGSDYVIASGKFSLWNVALCNLFRSCFSMAVTHGTEVNLSSTISRALVNISLRQFDKVVAVSNYTKALMEDLSISVDVIPNGINMEEWNVAAPDKKNKSVLGTPVLTTVGRVSDRKGQKEVVKLLPELINIFPEVHYHCIGLDDETLSIKTLVKQLGVDAHVSFHGMLDAVCLKQYLAQTDVFVMLSLPGNKGDVEGFGIAILEANAIGIPAIGALGSGVEDAIFEGQSGHLVTLGDAKVFIESLQAILNHKEEFRSGALKWAEVHDWKIIVKQYMQLLR